MLNAGTIRDYWHSQPWRRWVQLEAEHMPPKRYAFIFGLLAGLGFAPLPFWPLTLLGIGWLFATVVKYTNYSPRQLFSLCWSWGCGYHVVSLYWICAALFIEPDKYLWLLPFAVTLIPACLAIFIAIMGLLYQYVLTHYRAAFINCQGTFFALCWIIGELLRSDRLFFGGFPWNLTGYVWWFSNTVLQFCAIIGIYGMTFLTVYIATQVGDYLWLHRQKQHLWLSGAIVVIVLCYGQFRLWQAVDTAEVLRVRLVQNNVRQQDKMNPQYFATLKDKLLLKLFSPIGDSAVMPDLLVAGEAVLPTMLNVHDMVLTELMEALAKYRLQVPDGSLILGSLNAEFIQSRLENVYNSIYLFTAADNYDIYHKNLLVPFGEYVPLADKLPFLHGIAEMFGLSAGRLQNLLALKPGVKLLPLVCYEAIFNDYPYHFLTFPKYQQDKIVMVNLTNDNWFGKSSGPFQHLQIAKVRAIESGLPMVRVSDTGISAVIDAYGRVIAKSELNQEDVLDVELPLYNIATYYKQMHTYR